MSNNSGPNAGPPRGKGGVSHEEYYYDPKPGRGKPGTVNGRNGGGSGINAWVFLDLLAQRWHWLVIGGIICAAAFLVLGTRLVKEKYTASGKLLRYESPVSDTFKLPAVSPETFSALIRSPELLDRVSKTAWEKYQIPPLPPERFIKIMKVDPASDSDMVDVLLADRDPNRAVNMLNLYLQEAVAYTRKLQQDQAALLSNDYLKKQLQQMDEVINDLQRQFRNLPAGGLVTNSLVNNKLAAVGSAVNSISNNLAAAPRQSLMVGEQSRRLQKAISELNDLLATYTEKHPSVRAKEGEIQALKNQLAQNSTNSGVGMPADILAPALGGAAGDPRFNPELDIVRTKMLSLEQARVQLANREYEAQLFAANAPGMAKVFAPATLNSVQANMRWLKVGIVAVFGALLGIVGSLMIVLLVEFVDNRLKTAEDVTRVTKLPVLTSLGDVHAMTPEDRSQWAFRTWTLLQGRLSPSANHGLVCGFTSSSAGEGRSTWIGLLAEAASLTGFRVLTIATRPSPNHIPPGHQITDEPHRAAPESAPKRPAEEAPMKNGNNHSSALTTNVLTAPMQVTEKLTGPNSQPMVHIPLPGWVWNLERRKQWREALGHWREIDNLVILVELPPASVPEAVLLGSNLPNIIWLTNSGTANAADTRVQLDTMRNARCNLVGAVLNREPAMSMRGRFPRWFSSIALMAALGVSPLSAQDTNAPAPASTASAAATVNTNRHFSVVNPSQRAAWQQRLTLGPGDVLNLALFGKPELTRSEVAIAPDGRISYLEAQDVVAAGLTIDELRERLDQALGEYRRAARTVITPVAFKSKKYYMLGKVMTKGVYTLDRPITVLEAIARAKGLENGLLDRNVVDLADFQRSFLARGGTRIPLNFEKLFQEGDLSQNIAIEPGDYIYLASQDVQEVYVVGEVRLPGTVTYNPQMTVVRAITARGGFTERAFRARVLVVRGSINSPEAFAVDTHAVTDGKARDFKLQPKDIIYVNSRPFIWVEEVADLAATAFIQSLITSWVGVDVIKPYRQ